MNVYKTKRFKSTQDYPNNLANTIKKIRLIYVYRTFYVIIIIMMIGCKKSRSIWKLLLRKLTMVWRINRIFGCGYNIRLLSPSLSFWKISFSNFRKFNLRQSLIGLGWTLCISQSIILYIFSYNKQYKSISQRLSDIN